MTEVENQDMPQKETDIVEESAESKPEIKEIEEEKDVADEDEDATKSGRGRGRERGDEDDEVHPRRKRSPSPQSTVLHVGNLTRNVTEPHLKEIFDHYGETKVGSASANLHPIHACFRGFAEHRAGH